MSSRANAVPSGAERKQFLRDPATWLLESGGQIPSELTPLLAQLSSLRAELAQISEQSRALSRAIGAAKKSGEPAGPLLAQKNALSTRERELEAQIEGIESRLIDICFPQPSAVTAAQPDDTALSVGTLRPDQIVVKPLDVQDCAAWDEFVRGCEGASVYHLSGWAEVIGAAFGHERHYLLAQAEGRVVGVLPLVRLNSRLFGNFIVSVPFFNYGGVLATDAAVRTALLDRAMQLAQQLGCSHIELRDRVPMDALPARTDKVAMWLQLPPTAEALWLQIGSKVRAQIKKARAHALSFRVGGVELLDDFYHVFAHNMRDLGTPVYSRDFFARVLRDGPGEPVLVVGSDSRGKPVTVALLLRFGGRMEVPWASTLRRANALNANMLLYWQMLEYACAQGCDTFDFGRSTQDAPTYRFKRQWGAQPVQLYWHYWLAAGGELPRLSPDNPKYRAAIAIWQRLPVWLTRCIGPPIVKNLP